MMQVSERRWIWWEYGNGNVKMFIEYQFGNGGQDATERNLEENLHTKLELQPSGWYNYQK